MEYRKLGKTNLQVSTIGFGTEYLEKKSSKRVMSVVHEAIDRGVNYFDLVFSFPEYRDNLGASFRGFRSKIIIAGHICCSEEEGNYLLTRDVNENRILFDDLLRRLHTDYVDIVIIQMVNEISAYEDIARPGGIYDLAKELKQQGKARFIGISGHKVPAVERAIRACDIDVLMFPINIVWDLVPGRKDIFDICISRDIGLVAMKPFAGGRIFQGGGEEMVTPVQAINYVLSQKSVSTVVPGLKDVIELREALSFFESTEGELNYGGILERCQEDLCGNCVYCNHCLPCPVGIDIGQVIRSLDSILRSSAKDGLSWDASYYSPGRIQPLRNKDFSSEPSNCTECEVCVKRCPFEVDIISKMRQAASALEGKQ